MKLKDCLAAESCHLPTLGPGDWSTVRAQQHILHPPIRCAARVCDSRSWCVIQGHGENLKVWKESLAEGQSVEFACTYCSAYVSHTSHGTSAVTFTNKNKDKFLSWKYTFICLIMLHVKNFPSSFVIIYKYSFESILLSNVFKTSLCSLLFNPHHFFS